MGVSNGGRVNMMYSALFGWDCVGSNVQQTSREFLKYKEANSRKSPELLDCAQYFMKTLIKPIYIHINYLNVLIDAILLSLAYTSLLDDLNISQKRVCDINVLP